MVRVQEHDFDIGAEIAGMRTRAAGAGAIAALTGLVRGAADGRPLEALTLEHYPGMTEAELAGIEAEARARWPLDDVLIVHRHGRLEPGEAIVLAAAASAHREAAFEAAAFLMDHLKTRAPFWKKEVSANGEERWVEAASRDADAADRWKAGVMVPKSLTLNVKDFGS